LLVGLDAVVPGDVEPITLYNNLPDAKTAFELTNTTAVNNATFYDEVNQQQFEGDKQPYRYGSYLVYEADTASQTWLVNSYVNITSQDVAAIYPQFMYESIFKTALNDENFKFEMTTEPYPVLYIY